MSDEEDNNRQGNVVTAVHIDVQLIRVSVINEVKEVDVSIENCTKLFSHIGAGSW